jgi:hypothetical protein
LTRFLNRFLNIYGLAEESRLDPILSLLDSTIGARQARMLGVLLVFLPIFFFAYWAVKRGARFVLRPIAGYAALRGLFARSPPKRVNRCISRWVSVGLAIVTRRIRRRR